MTQRIQLRRGVKANLPSSNLLAGEALITTDRGTLHVATGATTKVPVVPALDDLSAIPAVDGATDFLLIHDASGSGQKECKITVDALKTALNIPAGSSDEKVAAVSGGTAGYLWGTDGTDGVLRGSASVALTKDVGNAYMALAVDVIDGGTF
ncbi:hyaluronate lyase N-terminal domain-containing protein [Lamprocystis purpurea]|jgi:hypothetical protein|uniref:hyaluronate lyase N-terminal domain-containing protein n=1 Tax=Lamprocystis purpurea TaxID=61598 RepID=UPI00036B79EE|nr:hypothetical protein [Lamprocystis purpurea]MBV5347917.1 hypothetical protein [bacterium]